MGSIKKRKDGLVSKRKDESRYIRMVSAIFKVCRRQCVPLYSSRYSRKDYTLWPHIALVALMQRIRKSYREYANDYLTTTERLLDVLGLSKIPHFTTIEKVPPEGARHIAGEDSRRVHRSHKDQAAGLLSRLVRLLPSPRLPLLLPQDEEGRPVVDEEPGQAEGEEREMKTRSFVKLTIGAELKTQLVTSIKVRRGPANDNRDFRASREEGQSDQADQGRDRRQGVRRREEP
jgi:hypothetical protein